MFFFFHAGYDDSELGLVAMDCLVVYLIVNGDKFDGIISCNYLLNSIFTETIFKNFKNTFVIITADINDSISGSTFVMILREYMQVLILQIQDLVPIYRVIEYIQAICITMGRIFFKWKKNCIYINSKICTICNGHSGQGYGHIT